MKSTTEYYIWKIDRLYVLPQEPNIVKNIIIYTHIYISKGFKKFHFKKGNEFPVDSLPVLIRCSICQD